MTFIMVLTNLLSVQGSLQSPLSQTSLEAQPLLVVQDPIHFKNEMGVKFRHFVKN